VPESCVPAAVTEQRREAAGLRPRPRRSRAGGLAAAVAGLALLAAAAGCSSGGGDKTSDSKAAGPPKGIQVPAKIASLKKIADDPAEEFKGTGVSKSVARNLHSVLYRDSADDQLQVVVTGGPGLPIPTDGPSDKVKALFTEWDLGANGKPTTSAATGSAGGSAECATVESDQWCGWVNGKVALTINFENFSKKKALALIPQILTAMVRT
jgi:hypothetical protein